MVIKTTNICGLTSEELVPLVELAGGNSRHAVEVATSLYRKRIFSIPGFEKVPKRVKEALAAGCRTGIYYPSASQRSADGTVKYAFINEEGLRFETVYIPGEKRRTVCVSTQSGCRMGCPFCVTGKFGFYGNLSAGDILNQVLSLPDSGTISHVVFMGMGEPMDNIDNVLKACDILSAERGLAISPRKTTVSTVGITPGIRRFLERSECNLALSLYSPFKNERIMMVPAERKYPVSEIIKMIRSFPLGKRRRISIAYMMIDGVNDTDVHLTGIRDLLRDSGIRVNLLPYHSFLGDENIPSSPGRMEHFKHFLVTSGISASVRKSRGLDISAACGLLASGLAADHDAMISD
ncbi:MAG: 23S rRNA (adenine(2503)-C(2))-methyltransferase RlmN [Bacteroidales bacterium]